MAESSLWGFGVVDFSYNIGYTQTQLSVLRDSQKHQLGQQISISISRSIWSFKLKGKTDNWIII